MINIINPAPMMIQIPPVMPSFAAVQSGHQVHPSDTATDTASVFQRRLPIAPMCSCYPQVKETYTG